MVRLRVLGVSRSGFPGLIFRLLLHCISRRKHASGLTEFGYHNKSYLDFWPISLEYYPRVNHNLSLVPRVRIVMLLPGSYETIARYNKLITDFCTSNADQN